LANPAGLLPLAIASPMTGAVAVLLAAKVSRRLPVYVALASLAGTAGVLAASAPRVFGGSVLVDYVGGWTPVHGAVLGIALAADPLGLTYALLCAAIGSVLVLFTASQHGGLGRRENGQYLCLFLLMLAALIGAGLTGDLFDLFVWFEVAALSSYGLAAFFLERPIALEASFKILVLTTIASFAVFVGTALLYRETGALNYGQLHGGLTGSLGAVTVVGLGLLVAGYATKAGMVPFHAWLPDAHTAAPGTVSALFSGLMVNLGVVAIARICFQIAPPHTPALLGIVTAIGVASALFGASMALIQDDLKRLLAYDTVSQMGILAVGFASAAPTGVAGAVYHLVNHALFKSLLFLCAAAIVHSTGYSRLSQMGGLLRHRPLIAAGFGVGVLSIAGLPPLNGYASLGLIHAGLEQRHAYGTLVLVLLAQVLTVAALTRAAYLGFLRHRAEPHERMDPLRNGMRVGLAVIGAACIAFGSLPGLVLNHVAVPAASALLRGHAFASALLHGHGRIQPVHVAFTYLDPVDLALVAATAAAGVALAAVVIRAERLPGWVERVRDIHTGSVNDYATYATAGIVLTLVGLLVVR